MTKNIAGYSANNQQYSLSHLNQLIILKMEQEKSVNIKYTPLVVAALVDLASANNYYKSSIDRRSTASKLSKIQKATKILSDLFNDKIYPGLNLRGMYQYPANSNAVGKNLLHMLL